MEYSGEKWSIVVKCGDLLTMFRGINFINLDTKGRIAIPVRYRPQLQNLANNNFQLIVTIDTEEKCLLLYPFSFWEEIEKKIDSLPSFNPVTRRIQRLLIGHAVELELDINGRVLLPPLLREYASFEKNLILIGQGKKFELWDKKIWTDNRDKWLANGLNELSDIPAELQTLSL